MILDTPWMPAILPGTTASAASTGEVAAGTDAVKFVSPATLAPTLAALTNPRATAGGLAFDGTASTRVFSTLTNQNIGTDAFSLVVKFKPTSASQSGGLLGLGSTSTDFSSGFANTFSVSFNAGALQIYITGAAGNYLGVRIVGFAAAYLNKTVLVKVVKTSGGAEPVVYVNGVVAATTAAASAGTAPWTGSVTSTFLGVGYTTVSSVVAGPVYGVSLYNLALSQADATEIYELGGAVPERLKFGSQTAISSGSLTIGKAYRITAAGGTFTGVGSADNSIGTVFVATGTTPTWSTGAVVRAGAVAHYDGDDLNASYQWQDGSTNLLHALRTATGTAPTKQILGPFPVRLTSDGTTAAQQLGGGTLFPANVQFTRILARARTGTPSITLGTSSGGSQIVASVALTANWQNLTIALTGGVSTTAASVWMTASTANVVEVQISAENLSA